MTGSMAVLVPKTAFQPAGRPGTFLKARGERARLRFVWRDILGMEYLVVNSVRWESLEVVLAWIVRSLWEMAIDAEQATSTESQSQSSRILNRLNMFILVITNKLFDESNVHLS